MNNFFYLTATALTLCLVACNKQERETILPQDNTWNVQSNTGKLIISLGTAATKGVNPKNGEMAINKYLICIYNNDTGQLELDPYEVTSVPSSSVDSIILGKVPFGNKTVAMVANYATRPDTETFTKFMNSVTDLKDNTATNLVMAASDKNVAISGGDNIVTLTLSRVAAKIHIGKIKASFSSDSRLNNPTIHINSVSVGNAAKTATLSGTFYSGLYSPYTPSANFTPDSAVKSITSANGFDLTLSTSFQDINKELYTYPYADDKTPSYLVIGALFNGTQRYYRYILPEIKSNTFYNVDEITVTGAPDTNSLDISIIVGQWDEDTSLSKISL